MTKKVFRRHIIISSLLTVIAIALILIFCISMFNRYSKPSEKNTSIESGAVAEVYYAVGKNVVIVEMSNGDQFQLVYPNFARELFSTIGYDLDELDELLKDNEIEYRRMSELPWIVEIYVDGLTINNNELTEKQIVATRIGIVILGIIMLVFSISGDVIYLKNKYKQYKKAEKKRVRKERRRLEKTT